ncbi:MAG: TIGR04283 family arsenosugar biosynthesis glycosyltransferase [Bacillota bacterium]
MSELISVIIPVLNEEERIVDIIEHVNNLAGQKEVIVVDGGSIDQTYELAENLADKVCETKAGRAQQMNCGAKAASGDVYLFLHCDSQLESGSLLALDVAMRDEEVVGGCFKLQIDSDSWPLRFISWSSNLRAKYLNLIFGDQGIFVRQEVFAELGGYPEIELMEDWEFSRKLAKVGKLNLLDHQIYTSARRWEKNGIWKTIWLMHKIKFLYLLGVSPAKLKEMYKSN